MRKFSRVFVFGALALVLLTAACNAASGTTPTPGGTLLPLETSTLSPVGGITATVTAGSETPTAATQSVATIATSAIIGSPAASQTAGIPVTGSEIQLVQCQFCVDNIAHALLVLPDTATFSIVSPAPSTTTNGTTINTGCSTIEVNNGKQVVLCNGLEKTSLTLNICVGSNCTNLPVQLMACPVTQQNTAVPAKTQQAPATSTGGGTGNPTATPTLAASATPTPGVTSTP